MFIALKDNCQIVCRKNNNNYLYSQCNYALAIFLLETKEFLMTLT